MPVHVSLHDVTPAFASDIESALAQARRWNLRPALLVVPDFHGAWPLEQHPAFSARLRELAAAGHPIYLHGLTHRAEPRASSAVSSRLGAFFRQRVVSAGEAEFASIGDDEAERRLGEGVARLTALGLPINGFVAPAWSMRPALIDQLAALGIRYTEDHLFTYDTLAPSARRRRPSLLLNLASRDALRRVSSVGFCRAMAPASLLIPSRVAIHPTDMKWPGLRREIERLLRWAEPFRGAPETRVAA